jgi:uncharacterized protein YutE (UPF0331/DUF86 family)
VFTSTHPTFAKLGPKIARARAELDALDAFLATLTRVGSEPSAAWGRATAIAAAVHNVYNGIEDILSSLARDVDGHVPAGEASHRDLLDQMAAPIEGVRGPVLDDRAFALLSALKDFRHVVRHRYGMEIDLARAEENLARLRQAFPALIDAIRALEREMVHRP